MNQVEFYPRLALFIDGVWHYGEGRATRAVVSPTTEEVLGQLPVATEADIDRALAAAARALPAWRQRSPQQRAEVLVRAAALLRERREVIAQTITLELGKPLAESRSEFERMAVCSNGMPRKAAAPTAASCPRVKGSNPRW